MRISDWSSDVCSSDLTVLRPSIVFGPDDSFFNRFAAMALIMPVLPLIGGGLTKFQPVYVDDVADAALAALEQGGASGVTYELGGPSVYTFRQLLELMLAEIRRQRLLEIGRAHACTPVTNAPHLSRL